MTALQQSIGSFAVFVLSTLLLQAITLSTFPGIPGEHFNNPNHVTLILDRIQALSDIVEKLYKEINPKIQDANNPIPPFTAPCSSLEKVAKSIVTYVLMVSWMSGLYLFLDGLQSVRSHVLRVYLVMSMLLAANLGLIVMLLFLPVRPWYQYVSGTIVAGGLGLLYAMFTCAKDDL